VLSRTRPRRPALLAPGQRIRTELFPCGAGATDACTSGSLVVRRGNEIKGGTRPDPRPPALAAGAAAVVGSSLGPVRGRRRRCVHLHASGRVLVMSYQIVVSQP